jgi:Peptidase MA superfamily
VSRPVLHLWPTVVRRVGPILLPAAAGLILGWPYAALGGWVTCVWLLAGWSHLRWLWWFASIVRRFETVRGAKVILLRAPDLGNNPFLPTFLKTVETRLRSLSGQFGFPLRRTVAVYLFARTQQITDLFGPTYGACALPALNAIALAEDCDWEEIVEHELAHLFAARWNPSAPPILREGLAVWLQGAQFGRPVVVQARAVLADSSLGLGTLLDPQAFFSPARIHDCYALAGSFTGFLIRRFGWDGYRRLYRRCDGRRFREKFRACTGITLDEAERNWRSELGAMGS